MPEDTLTVTDNRTGETYEMPITDGTVKAMDFRQMKVDEDDFGLMTYDPAFTNTASCRSEITYIDGEAGMLEHRGYPDRAAVRALDLPRGGLPAGARRAADQGRSSTTGCTRSPTTPTSTRTSRSRWRASATTPTRCRCCSPRVGALSTFYPGAKDLDDRDRALHGGRPADRQDAHARGLRVPPQPRAALRLSGQRPLVHGQLPLDALQDDRGQVRARPAARARPRRALDPARRPRAELLDRRRCGRSAPRRWTPTRRSRPASPRSTARCTAAPTRRC